MYSLFLTLFFFFFFFKQKTAYEMLRSLVGSEMCIRDSINAEYGRSVNIVPYIFGDNSLYMCMTIEQQDYYTVLVQYYLPSFSEQYPKVLTFSASDVSSCNPISGTEAALYKAAGWTDIERDRQYGCKLTPPVSGTIAPCTCDIIYSCDTYKRDFFQPPGLDIGRCVCCTTWVMAVASAVTAGFLLLIVWIIYKFV
eukprot:TRINITY_DN13261_c0_g1_i1.p1 TRINITY_DN13261_c0_g1~~TRINITY_DN13261_c0_g1_i1.p1  ORF type:complete len:196 (-),score=46.49 TRINITY_DN13261_c0_g1_i1:356-943(-)